MTDLLALDQDHRRRALGAGSFIVEAPAGAGKTELLTQRVLKLLAGVEAPEEIVAITFTRKAAAEMRERILESLARAADDEVPAAAHKRLTRELAAAVLAASARRGWQLLDNPSRLRILTIDAFCAGLARQMPLLSRFGGEPRVVDAAGRHYREAARRTLALVAAPEEALAGPVAAALAHLDNDTGRLAALLEAMLARRDQWLGHAVNHPPVAAAREALAQLVAADLATVAAALPPGRQAPLMPVAAYAAGQMPAASAIAALLDWTRPLTGDLAELPRWHGLAELLLTQAGTPRKQITKAIGLPADKGAEPHKAALKAWLEGMTASEAEALARVRRLPAPDLSESDWAAVTALASLLKLAAAQLWQVFREAGEVDFVEVAQRALMALGDADAPTDLALTLDYRIRHLLVDEFQDTNRVQVDLLARLTAGWTPGDGRSLFLVGDPMQSIYRFRKADVGLFLEVARGGIGGLPLERLSLCRNNRSDPRVVEWIDRAFRQVFPDRDAPQTGAIAYRPFAAAREPMADAAVQVHALVGPGQAADGREARQVLAIVDAARRGDPARSIAVLVRAKHHLAPLVAEIRRYRPDLRYSAVEIDPLADRQPVQDLLSLAHALYHRADRLHWLAILRAPWCGLTLADLHALAGDDHRATVWSLMADGRRLARLSADGQARLAHLRQALTEAWAWRGRSRPRRWLEGVWLRLGGAACLAEAADRADVAAFLDLADRLDDAGRFDPATLEEETARLFAAPDAEADGRLQFMSIHKAKGLEFDTVIVPGLHRRARGDDAALVLWEPVTLAGGGEGLVAAPLPSGGGTPAGPGPYDYLRRLEAERAGHEAERLLYVAATRAQRALHWLAALEPAEELRPPAGSLLELLWPAVAGEFRQAPAGEALAADAAEVPMPPPLRRLAAPSSAAFPPSAPGAAGGPAVAGETAPGAEEAVGEPLDAHVGTLLHAYLEFIARDGPAAWPAARFDALVPAMVLWLAQQGHDEAAAREGAERCRAALRATLASEAGRWVLQPRPDAAAEWALMQAGAGGTAMHIVDRTFVEDGVRWIIDYKTARAGADVAGLAAHAERYREQLARYAALFRDEGTRLRLGVFYTASGRLVELETDSD